jgi:PKHD-type hydroxylase
LWHGRYKPVDTNPVGEAMNTSGGQATPHQEENVAEKPWTQQSMLATTLAGVLSPAECETVKQLAMAAGLNPSLAYTSKGVGKNKQRTSYQALLPRAPEIEWLYEKIRAVGDKANAQHWRFTITGMENMQVLRYRPLQRFKWHTDSYPGSGRKITCVVNLATPGSHWRGKLQLMGSHLGHTSAGQQGAATFFPSYLLHRATAPWWGERWSLVAWFTGPPMT